MTEQTQTTQAQTGAAPKATPAKAKAKAPAQAKAKASAKAKAKTPAKARPKAKRYSVPAREAMTAGVRVGVRSRMYAALGRRALTEDQIVAAMADRYNEYRVRKAVKRYARRGDLVTHGG